MATGTEPLPIAESRQGDSIWPSSVQRVWLVITVVVSAIVFLLTLHTPPSPVVAFHYLALLIFVGTVSHWIAKRFTRKWATGIAVLAAIVAAYFWGRSDYYVHEWQRTTDDKKDTWHYTDYTYRNHAHQFYRVMTTDWEKPGYYHSEGGFSDSGKMHGEWQSYSAPSFDTKNEWFWYGESITEGEWHLRNR